MPFNPPTRSGRSQIHLTPRSIVDALGPFDLDPCAANPRPWDCARVNYTLHENGLRQRWHGRVWLNPPFDRYEVGVWISRLAEHGRGVALLHARTDTVWFQRCWECASGLLFLGARVRFLRADGCELPFNTGAPCVLVAFGDHDLAALRGCGLAGALVTEWEQNQPQ